MRRIYTLFCVFCVLLTAFVPVTATGAEAECTHTVMLEDAHGAPVDGVTVFLCQVAECKEDTYVPAAAFAQSGLSVTGLLTDNGSLNATHLLRYVQEHEVASLSDVSSNGQVTFDHLEPGIWLVYSGEDGTHCFDPYLAVLPYKDGDAWQQTLVATPKTQENTQNNKSVYVLKTWDDRDNAAGKRPKEIVVTLKNNGVAVEQAVLHEGKGWAYTFSGLLKTGVYTVEEQAVADYTAQYSGDSENGFIITNTYVGEKLPQTGQVWWPVAVLGLAGLACLLLGLLELKGKRHETTG